MRLLPIWAVVLLCALTVHALDVPPTPPLRVNDYAGVLSVEDGRSLDAMLAEHERATTNQVVIAIFPTLGGENLEAYSMRLAEAWKVGQAGKDNGVIISVFLEDRKVRIEVGYGLEGALPDVLCKRIIDEEITPRFREQDYAGGLRAAVARMASGEPVRPAAAELPRSASSPGVEIGGVAIFVLVIGLAVSGMFGAVGIAAFAGWIIDKQDDWMHNRVLSRTRDARRIARRVWLSCAVLGAVIASSVASMRVEGVLGLPLALLMSSLFGCLIGSGAATIYLMVWDKLKHDPPVLFPPSQGGGGSSGSSGDWSSGSSSSSGGSSGGGGSFGGGGASGGW